MRSTKLPGGAVDGAPWPFGVIAPEARACRYVADGLWLVAAGMGGHDGSGEAKTAWRIRAREGSLAM